MPNRRLLPIMRIGSAAPPQSRRATARGQAVGSGGLRRLADSITTEWIEHRDLMSAICERASDGDETRWRAEIVRRQHGKQELGHGESLHS